ncbi:hypothetical protein ACP4OV_016350 [Aristida adscensionis]
MASMARQFSERSPLAIRARPSDFRALSCLPRTLPPSASSHARPSRCRAPSPQRRHSQARPPALVLAERALAAAWPSRRAPGTPNRRRSRARPPAVVRRAMTRRRPAFVRRRRPRPAAPLDPPTATAPAPGLRLSSAERGVAVAWHLSAAVVLVRRARPASVARARAPLSAPRSRSAARIQERRGGAASSSAVA